MRNDITTKDMQKLFQKLFLNPFRHNPASVNFDSTEIYKFNAVQCRGAVFSLSIEAHLRFDAVGEGRCVEMSAYLVAVHIDIAVAVAEVQIVQAQIRNDGGPVAFLRSDDITDPFESVERLHLTIPAFEVHGDL